MINKNIFSVTIDLEDGRKIVLETGKLAKQADGAVVVKIDKTMILATVVSSKEAKEGQDFLPLTVDYTEKYAASGRIPGGFNKREARLSNHEILVSRIVDRTLRPLFPKEYHNEIQVIITLISSDDNVMPDNLAGLAASAALSISSIPFQGPISEVRVARINGEFKVNPSTTDLLLADLDIIVAGSEKDINMVEGSMKEVGEDVMLEAIKKAHEAIKVQCQAQDKLVKLCGKPKQEVKPEEVRMDLKQKVEEHFRPKIQAFAENPTNKHQRNDGFSQIWKDFEATLTEEEKEDIPHLKKYHEETLKDVVRNLILNENKRLDGRKTDEVREIECEVDFLPGSHGSALFTRGETQSLTSVTLGSKMDEQMIDGAVFQGYDKFILHYNFPPFSTGEVKPQRGPGRREIGHGNLAKRALEMVLPSVEDNPYTIRVVSDILESNGSSSMATVCAGCLALMDAGIKIKNPVSGIAMGLIIDHNTRKFAILSDILGDEDHLGDMDFKVTGTELGITACQMDIKVDGLTYEMLQQALDQAKKGRLHILNIMKQTLAKPNPDYKPHAPRIEKFYVANEFIGTVIGPGGKMIQSIQKETGSTISITEVPDGRGLVEICTKDQEAMQKAVKWISGITQKPEVGKTYDGIVKSVVDFGVFVEILPGKEGLLHNSEYSWDRNVQANKALKKYDHIDVKLIAVDFKTGKFKLSHKELTPREQTPRTEPPKEVTE